MSYITVLVDIISHRIWFQCCISRQLSFSKKQAGSDAIRKIELGDSNGKKDQKLI